MEPPAEPSGQSSWSVLPACRAAGLKASPGLPPQDPLCLSPGLSFPGPHIFLFLNYSCVGGARPHSFPRKGVRHTHGFTCPYSTLTLVTAWPSSNPRVVTVVPPNGENPVPPSSPCCGSMWCHLTPDLWHETCSLFSLDILGAFLLSPVFSVWVRSHPLF